MPARHHVSPDQLSMFMPARDLREGHHPTDAGALPVGDDETAKDNVKRTWRQKEREASSPEWNQYFYEGDHDTLADDVKERGIQRPVTVGRGELTGRSLLHDGHHRVAAAYANDPATEVPVQHLGYP